MPSANHLRIASLGSQRKDDVPVVSDCDFHKQGVFGLIVQGYNPTVLSNLAIRPDTCSHLSNSLGDV
jgi:hypothetical protein